MVMGLLTLFGAVIVFGLFQGATGAVALASSRVWRAAAVPGSAMAIWIGWMFASAQGSILGVTFAPSALGQTMGISVLLGGVLSMVTAVMAAHE